MAKFKAKYPMNGNSIMLQPKRPDALVEHSEPQFKVVAGFIDEDVVGSISNVFDKKVFKQKELSAFQLWEEIKKHGVSENPVTRLPRIIGLLLKLEEMGLKGDLDAIKLYLDRVVGKQPENLMVHLSKYEALSDGDLLDMVHSDGTQKSIPSPQTNVTASPSQEEEIIDG